MKSDWKLFKRKKNKLLKLVLEFMVKEKEMDREKRKRWTEKT